LISSPVESPQEKEEPFVNEATETSDAGWNSEANHPTGLGTERVGEEEEEELGEAQAISMELQWEEVLLKQMREKRGAKQRH